MHTKSFIQFHRRLGLAAFVALGLSCFAPACVDDPADTDMDLDELRAGDTGGSSTEPSEDGNPPGTNEGSEVNEGVEGPLTITAQSVADMLSAGGVSNKFGGQNQAEYVGAAVHVNGLIKVESLTGEQVVDSQVVNNELVGVTANYEFRLSAARNQLYLHHRSRRFSDVPASAVVNESVILQQAQADIQALGVTLGAGTTLVVDRLMRASSNDPANPEAVAYKVVVRLAINGHLVEGPRVVLSYFLDGELHKVSARWPAITSPSGPPSAPTMAVAAQHVYTALASHPLGAETGSLEAEAGLAVVNGQLRHIVMVRGMLSDGQGGGRMGQLDVLMPL